MRVIVHRSFHSRRAFVDASGYFALTNDRDGAHSEATIVFDSLKRERYRFFTTTYMLAELHALLVSRVNRRVALAVLTEIDQSHSTTIVRVQQQDEQRARAILLQYSDRDFSLADALSFAVMERLQLNQAIAFDHHFAQFGWHVIRADR